MLRSFKRMQPILAYVAARLDQDVSLKTLADEAALSPFHLHRVFAATMGETPKQVTLRLRLERAAVLLLTTGDSVLDVALSSGFQSHEIFCRVFRRRFGMTPSVYRERGFVNEVNASQTRRHARLVKEVGPCIGLYRISEETRPEKDIPYSIEKKELSPQPVLVMRRKVARSAIAATIGESLPHVFLYAQQKGIALAGLPFTRYIELGLGTITMEPGMRIAAPGQDPIPVEPAWTEVSGEGHVVQDTLPGGPAAVTVHMGPYDKLPEAYEAMELWIQSQGLIAAGPPWESYVTDPSEHPDPKDWKTEIFWPLVS